MSKITMKPVEAYALESSYIIADGWHTFIVDDSRSIEWTNFGRGWADGGNRECVASTRLYFEWANHFVPCSKVVRRQEGDKKLLADLASGTGGIDFAVNGVCHTLANRILVIADGEADVRKAKGDHHSVFFYGKYGFGLEYFKQLVREAHAKAASEHDIPEQALTTVLSRIDNYLDDELLSWRYIAQEVVKIPVDDLLRKNIQGGLAEARRRLQAYVNEREAIYKKYPGDATRLQTEIKNAILKHGGDYLNFLQNIGYITAQEKDRYLHATEAFLNHFIRSVNQLRAVMLEGTLL